MWGSVSACHVRARRDLCDQMQGSFQSRWSRVSLTGIDVVLTCTMSGSWSLPTSALSLQLVCRCAGEGGTGTVCETGRRAHHTLEIQL
jgi:hypothetical protein